MVRRGRGKDDLVILAGLILFSCVEYDEFGASEYKRGAQCLGAFVLFVCGNLVYRSRGNVPPDIGAKLTVSVVWGCWLYELTD